MTVFLSRTGALIALLIMTGVATTAVAQENLRETLFAQTDAVLKAANEARASVLAPKNYSEGARRYREAEEKLSRGRSIESIKKDLASASVSLRKAIEATRLAEVTLTTAIQARNDAEEANAAQFASEPWRDAEEKFAAAATRLEDGNVRAARSRAADAEQLFRAAELAAVKTNYLDEARRLIGQAKSDRVDRYAPKTLGNAESLLSRAEKALNDNRYDTDEPRSLARQARYEVKHAMYLASVLKPVRDRDVSLEDFALASEKPIERIATTLDLVVELDQGYDAPITQITSTIETLQHDSYELNERRVQIAELEQEIQSLESRLGTQSQRLASQEAQRQKFRQLETMFGRDEALVLTQGQNVLIRPIGLVFPSGSAQIEPQYFSLLRKLQDAIRIFPDSTVEIEGHTDSFGGDEINLKLSQDRAEAVRQYLLANMSDVTSAEMMSVGFGESRPVANNETVDGRAKNRRIDLVIRPRPGGAQANID